MMGWQALANAIVAQAAKDYRAALCVLKKNREDRNAMAAAMEVEDFFRSDGYQLLTDVDGDYLIERLRKEAAE